MSHFFVHWIHCYFVLILGSLFKARTLCTSTKALTAQFEHTILITDVGHEAGGSMSWRRVPFWVRGDRRMQPNKKCVYLYIYMYYVQICLHSQLYIFFFVSVFFWFVWCIYVYLRNQLIQRMQRQELPWPIYSPSALWLGSLGKREVSYRKNQDGGFEMASKSRYNSQVANVGRCWLVHVLTTKPSRMSRWMTAATLRCKTFFFCRCVMINMICYTIFF